MLYLGSSPRRQMLDDSDQTLPMRAVGRANREILFWGENGGNSEEYENDEFDECTADPEARSPLTHQTRWELWGLTVGIGKT